MRKFLASLLILLTFIVYFKPIAVYTGGIMTGLKEPQKKELKEITIGEIYIYGITKDNKKIFIPWDAVAYVEES